MANRATAVPCLSRALLRNPPPLCAAIPQARCLRTRAGKSQDGDAKPRKKGFLHRIETMPFQTYQLALGIIKKDREEKLKQLVLERERLARAIQSNHGPRVISSLQRHIERLEILADINNPRVKYNFDVGIISLRKPVYRFLLERKWREMRRPILMQRLTQMKVIPDVLPYIDPLVDVQVRFTGRDVQPGAILPTIRTERHPTLKIIPFKPGQMLCTIAVIDSDVPDPVKDRYTYRLHWLVSNIPISNLQIQAIGTGSRPSNTIVPWLPPHCQKGIQYHRYALFVFKQHDQIDTAALEGKVIRDGFIMRSFQAKHNLEPIGAFMWRNEWDSTTKEVMQRHNLPGWDIMWKRLPA